MNRLFLSICVMTFTYSAIRGQSGAYTSLDGTFGQPTQYISELTDVLYNASNRFTVTPNKPSLFDGLINNVNWAIEPGAPATITIDLTTKGELGSNGLTYTEGNIYVSFYY